MSRHLASVTDLVPNLLRRLTEDPLPTVTPLGDAEPVERVVLMVLDGFGWDQLNRALKEGLMPQLNELIRAGRGAMRPITTVFPSMTPVALTSILTGCYPSQHGIVGQVLMLPSGPHDVLHDKWPEEFSPAVVVPDLATKLREQGLSYQVLLEHRLRSGPLTDVLHGRSPSLTTFIAASGFAVLLGNLLDREARGVIYAYWSAIDTINHQRGAFRAEWRAEVQAIDHWLSDLQSVRRMRTRVWITADHGHVELTRALPYGALRKRLPWLPERPAEVGNGIGLVLSDREQEAVRGAAEALFPGRVEIQAVDRLFADGRFGPSGPSAFQRRIGTHLLWAPHRGDHWMVDQDQVPYHSSHGGLTPEEMKVPWVEIRLD